MSLSFLERIKPLYGVEVLEGYTGEEMEQLKEMFGALPQVLEDYYRTAGRTDAFHHVQDRWILPENFQMLYGAASEASYAKLRTVLEDIGEPV